MALTAQTDGKEWGCDVTHMIGSAAVILESVKAGPGTIFGISLSNSTATIYYLQIFNRTTAPTASSATDFMFSIPIPANTAVGGREISILKGIGCSVGIAMKLCGGLAGNDNTICATGVSVVLLTK